MVFYFEKMYFITWYLNIIEVDEVTSLIPVLDLDRFFSSVVIL